MRLSSALGAGLRPSEAPALLFEAASFDYRRLIARTQRAAGRLHHEWGIAPGDRVAYLGANHADIFPLLFACAELGAIFVPLNWQLPAPELALTVAQCQPRVVLHDQARAVAAQGFVAGWAADPLPRVAALEALLQTPSARAQLPRAGAGASPVLLGYPRGILYTQSMLLAYATAAAQRLGAADRVLLVLPLFEEEALCAHALPALLCGAALVIHAQFKPGAWLAAVEKERPSHSPMTPTALRAVIAHADWAQADLSALRQIWLGSGLPPADLVAAFAARGVALLSLQDRPTAE